MLPEYTFLLQGVDVIVNASSVEDIDAGAIGQRLSNGLARLSSPVLHRLRLREDENAEPVVSVCLGQASPTRASPASSVPVHLHPFVKGSSQSTQPIFLTHAKLFDSAGHHLSEN